MKLKKTKWMFLFFTSSSRHHLLSGAVWKLHELWSFSQANHKGLCHRIEILATFPLGVVVDVEVLKKNPAFVVASLVHVVVNAIAHRRIFFTLTRLLPRVDIVVREYDVML